MADIRRADTTRNEKRRADQPGKGEHRIPPPNEGGRERGSREGDPNAASITPGREFGASGQTRDGPRGPGRA